MSLFGSPDINKMKEKHDIDGLIKALKFSKGKIGTKNFNEIPNQAAEALGLLGDKKAVPMLIDSLEYWHPLSSRYSVIKSLGLLQDEQATAPLLRILERREPRDYRSTLFWALARLRSSQAIPPMIKILQDKSYQFEEDRKFARAVLILIGSRAVIPLIELGKRDKSYYYPVIDILGRISDPQATEFLLELLSDPSVMQQDSIIPGDVITALARIGDSKLIEPLQAIAYGSNRNLAVRARAAIDQINSNKAAFSKDIYDLHPEYAEEFSGKSNEELIKMLNEDNPNLSSVIPFLLGQRQVKSALASLCQRISGDRVSYDVRYQSIIALGKINDGKAIEKLINQFDNDWAFETDNFIAIEKTLSKLGWSPH